MINTSSSSSHALPVGRAAHTVHTPVPPTVIWTEPRPGHRAGAPVRGVVLVVAWLFSPLWLTANHGNFLPDTLDLGNIVNEAYGTSLTEFQRDVECPGLGKIGEIRFTYDTWTGNYQPGGAVTGGGALAGGFFYTGGIALKPGYQWGWVQTVRSTFSGNNVWGAPDGTTFPDTAGKLDIDYPFEFLPVADPPGLTLGFQDFPNRFPSDGDQFWLAELGLVCKNRNTATAHVLATFLWGFNVVGDQPGKLGGISPFAPGFWGPATDTYLNALNHYFDGSNGSTDWDITRGCDCFIPEPVTYTFAFALGLVGLVSWRRLVA